MPIYTYKSLGSIGHIMVGKPTKLSTDTTAIEFIVIEPPWSTLYEKRCDLKVYCRWHGLRVPKARSAELPRDEPANILAHLEQENNKMQRRLNRFHAIQKVRKHLKGKAQKRAIKSIKHLFYLQVKKALAWRVKKYWILDDWTHILPNERAQRSPLSQKLQVFHQHRLSYHYKKRILRPHF